MQAPVMQWTKEWEQTYIWENLTLRTAMVINIWATPLIRPCDSSGAWLHTWWRTQQSDVRLHNSQSLELHLATSLPLAV